MSLVSKFPESPDPGKPRERERVFLRNSSKGLDTTSCSLAFQHGWLPVRLLVVRSFPLLESRQLDCHLEISSVPVCVCQLGELGGKRGIHVSLFFFFLVFVNSNRGP